MKNQFFLFIDESGTSSLKNVDPNFPILVLTGLLISEKSYRDLVSDIDTLKRKYFGEKQIVLHRRDMRKYENGFEIFFDDNTKRRFYNDLNKILSESNYTLISSAIDKNKHIEHYGKLANDPYQMALSFVLERAIMETDTSHNGARVEVYIESRGRREDKNISERYNQLLYRGSYTISKQRFLNRFSEDIKIRKKSDGIVGIEIADLCAYPIARYLLNSNEMNPAFDVIRNRIRNHNGNMFGYGIKIFPK